MTQIIINSDYLKSIYIIKFMEIYKRRAVSNRGALSINNILLNLINYLRYIILINTFSPDTIYLTLAQNKFGFLRDSFFIIIGKLFRKTILVHFHGGNFDKFFSGQDKMYKKYVSYVFKKVDGLIVLAEKFKEQFKGFINVSKIFVLYNCLAIIKKSNSGFKSIASKKRERMRILFIGYLSKAKGALDLVKSIPLVLKKYPGQIEFVLCGQPVDIERNITFINDPHRGYTELMKIIKENNLDKDVQIITNLNKQEKEAIFDNSDIFVFPTYSDGCGMVALEAMSHKLPIITTKVSALEEMLKEPENCLFIEPGDFNMLADKISYLLNNPEKRLTMGQANHDLLVSDFNEEIFCNKLSVIWDRVLGR